MNSLTILSLTHSDKGLNKSSENELKLSGKSQVAYNERLSDREFKF